MQWLYRELEVIFQTSQEEEEVYFACLLMQRICMMKPVEDTEVACLMRAGWSKEEAEKLSEPVRPVMEDEVDLADLDGLRTIGDSAWRRWQNTIIV